MKWLASAALITLVAFPATAQPGPRMATPGGGLTPQMFQLLDSNKDGSVSDEEYRAYQDRRFRGFDGPGRGQFDRDHFRQRMSMMGRGFSDADREFGGYDADRDGTVTREEWMKWAEDRFKQRDTNRDGKISSEDPAPRASNMGRGMPNDSRGMGMMPNSGGPRR